MTVDIVRPNAEYNCNWNGPASNCYDAITQPTAGNGDYCECDKGDDYEIQEFSMGTISPVQDNSVTQVVVWIYGYAENTGVQPELDIYFAGSYETAQTCTFTTSDSWKSYTFSGLSGSQADLDALRVRFTSGAVGPTSEWWLDVMYCEITYTEETAPEAKGFAQTGGGSDAYNIPFKSMGFSATGEGADAFTIPYREMSFAQTATGSDTVTTPYRELVFIDAGEGTDLFFLLQELGFEDTGAGSDVFGSVVISLEVGFADAGSGTDVFEKELAGDIAKGFADAATGSDVYTIPYKAMVFAQTATSTDTYTIIYKSMGMIDAGYASDVFQKEALGEIEDALPFISIAALQQITTTSTPFIHQVTHTHTDIQQIKITTENIE